MNETKWTQALTHLLAAQAAIGGEDFGDYVDVPSTGEALEQLVSDLQWKVFKDAGPVFMEDGRTTSRRLIDGEAVGFMEFWQEGGP